VIWTAKGLQGEYGLDKDEAWDLAADAARNVITHEFGLNQPPSRDFVRHRIMRLKDDSVQEMAIDGVGKVFLVKFDLELTRLDYRELAEADRAARVSDRLEGAARGLGVLVAVLGALGAYIRLDDATKGYYTGRLRLAAVVLAGAALFLIARS
jgi:hypothetical protein